MIIKENSKNKIILINSKKKFKQIKENKDKLKMNQILNLLLKQNHNLKKSHNNRV
jgi:hypothetical protein